MLRGGPAIGRSSAADESASSSGRPAQPTPSASPMQSLARALGMGKGQQSPPAQPMAPPPNDLPNPQAPNAADTNSVFYVDDTLSELARVRRYSLSQLPLQRLVYVKRLSACGRTVGLQECLTQLLPLFTKLCSDQEAVVRTAAAAELANMAHFLADPMQPFNPNATPLSLAASALSTPSTAQSPDLTLEDELIIDFEVTDVDNTLPAALPASASASTDPLGVSSSATPAVSTPDNNPDAMDVDSVATPPSKPSPEASSPISDDPMDVSEADHAEPEPEPQLASVAEDSPVPPALQEEQKAPEVPTNHASPALEAIPSPSSTNSSSSSLASAPSSPLSLSAAVPSAVHHSPLTDPTSMIRMESYEQIKETIIPCLQTLILDGNAEVRTAACESLVRVADVLRGDDVGKVVLTLVLNLAHDERDEQRTTAVNLMHELAPRLGHDLCRSFVALELAAFADDSTFRVRKATAQSFGNVCDMVGESFTVAKLLPCYVRLSKDIIWGVRSSAAKSLVAVTRVVGPAVRTEVLIPMLERFTRDSSRWVRNGAYEILGPFLHALGPELASKELVAYFAAIPTMSSAIVDQEVNFHAAFNLPAVLMTIGPQRWEAELMPAFQALARDSKFPVRRTLAYSLHEIAALLGPALTESSLLGALDSFLRDVDEVRYGVLKHFAYLLKCMTPAKRVAYLEVLWMVQRQNQTWRLRLLWAKQLGAFAKLFSAEKTVTDIMPLTFALCRDQVAAVRRTAAKALGHLLARLLSFAAPNSVVGPCIAEIASFATSATYMDRQLYLRMLEGFIGLLPSALFEEFLSRALPLATDKTSNVRLACVASMRELMHHAEFHHSPTAQKIVQTLAADSHREVSRTMLEAIHLNTTHAAATSALVHTLDNLALEPAVASDDLQDSDLADILASPPAAVAAAAAAAPAPIQTESPEPVVIAEPVAQVEEVYNTDVSVDEVIPDETATEVALDLAPQEDSTVQPDSAVDE